MIRRVRQALFNRVQGRTRTVQYELQVFLGDRPIGGVDEFPPTTDRFLHLGLRFIPHHEGINQPVHLTFNSLIGNRHFLGHDF